MPLSSPDFDTLAKRFDELRHADRRAILAHLNEEEQVRVLAALECRADTQRRERDAARRAGQQYAAYSPWLADVVRQVCTDGPTTAPLAAKTCQTIAEIHALLQQQEGKSPRLLSEMLRWAGLAVDTQGSRK